MSFQPQIISSKLNLPETGLDELQDLYVVFVNPDGGSGSLMVVMGIELKMLEEGEVIVEEKSSYDDFYVGKWDMMIIGTPQGDSKMKLSLFREDGVLKGSVLPEMENAESVTLDKVEETASGLTIYFSMMSYDINVNFEKEGDLNLKGKLMGMFDVTADRVIKEAVDYYVGNWKTTFIGTPQGDSELVLTLERKDGELTGMITPGEGAEAVKLDSVDEREEGITIYFNMMNYDLNVTLDKEDNQNMKGSLMGMFNVTAEKM